VPDDFTARSVPLRALSSWLNVRRDSRVTIATANAEFLARFCGRERWRRSEAQPEQ
jgi:hypothetical protein